MKRKLVPIDNCNVMESENPAFCITHKCDIQFPCVVLVFDLLMILTIIPIIKYNITQRLKLLILRVCSIRMAIGGMGIAIWE